MESEDKSEEYDQEDCDESFDTNKFIYHDNYEAIDIFKCLNCNNA